ncbi:mRNA splicing protein, partial [Cryomyces antarcticus]
MARQMLAVSTFGSSEAVDFLFASTLSLLDLPGESLSLPQQLHTMSLATLSLSKALPKPKYTGEDEDEPVHAQSKGPRIVGAGTLDTSQLVLKRSGPPPYGQRAGWRPRSAEDYGDGGAFPEIPVAQYPLDMGRKTTSSSNALAIQVD